MQKIEFALISALYDVKGADLYKEIYFPIIKYSVVDMYYDQRGEQKYFDLESLHKKINKLFGISVPLVILRQCAKALEKNKDGVSLRYYEDNKLIKVNDVWDFSVNESIDERANSIRQRYQQLEAMFQQYLILEKLDCEKNFFDFFSDYADEVSLFVNQQNADVMIDERYTNLTTFILWLKENDTDMYSLIDEILWGAIIAGFLRREKADLEIKATERVDYYLDSSLVLAILGLDSKENVDYAREMLSIIKDSSSRPIVHALTLREIDRILEQVEIQQEARPGSAIASSFEWQDMSLSKILNVRNSLQMLLDKNYGIVIGHTSARELDEIETKYRTRPAVKKLAEERGYSYSTDVFREIHDVYMCEMVQKANFQKSTTEKYNVYFVTLNRGLVKNDSRESAPSSVIHSGNVVMNLWLHAAHSNLLKKSGLIETVSRSLAMNKTDVRRRLRKLQKILLGAEIPEEDAKCMYKALLRRSEATIKNVDSLLENTDSLEDSERNKLAKNLCEAARVADEERQQSRMSDAANLECLKKEVESTKQALSDVQQGKLKAEDAILKLQVQVDTATKSQQEYKEQMATLEAKLEQQTRVNALIQQLNDKKNEKRLLEEKRQSSVIYLKFWFIVIFESLSVLLLLLLLVILFCNWDKNKVSTVMQNVTGNIGSLIGIVVVFLGLVLRFKDMYILTPKVKKNAHRKEQLASWDDRHPEYLNLIKEIDSLENQIRQNSQI